MQSRDYHCFCFLSQTKYKQFLNRMSLFSCQYIAALFYTLLILKSSQSFFKFKKMRPCSKVGPAFWPDQPDQFRWACLRINYLLLEQLALREKEWKNTTKERESWLVYFFEVWWKADVSTVNPLPSKTDSVFVDLVCRRAMCGHHCGISWPGLQQWRKRKSRRMGKKLR